MLTAAVPLLTRPTNSSMTLGMLPAASTRAGDAISSGTRSALQTSRRPFPARLEQLGQEPLRGRRQGLAGPGDEMPGPLDRGAGVLPFLQLAGGEVAGHGVGRDQGDAQPDPDALDHRAVRPEGEDPGGDAELLEE